MKPTTKATSARRGGRASTSTTGDAPNTHALIDEGTGAQTTPPLDRNLLIHGDNLHALRALAASHRAQVRCVYLDPPYNTGGHFAHYDDAREHSAWIEMMRERLLALKPLLHREALVFVQIDDREHAYLQLLMDDIFGRGARLNTICVKMSELSGMKMSHAAHRLPKLKEYILVYGASADASLKPVVQIKDEATLARYLRYYTRVIENPEAPVERWRIPTIREYLRARGLETTAEAVRAFQLQERDRVVYRTNNPLLASMSFESETARVISPTGIEYIWWKGRQMLFLKDHCESPLGDLWTDISTINLHREGGVDFRSSKKPEGLIERVLSLGSSPGDLVLDAFAGSGTTGAVAERRGRRWVMIEEGAHLHTHIRPRLAHLARDLDRPVDYALLAVAGDPSRRQK